MPIKRNHSKKGRLSGTARKEINSVASSKAIERTIIGSNEDTAFVRVTRMLGFGHARVVIATSHGSRELSVRIPQKFGKRGATPITTNSIVTIFVGKGFDPSHKSHGTEHFDITAILDDRQSRDLVAKKLLPAWMLKTADEIASGVSLEKVEEDGFDWEEADDCPGAALTKKELRSAKMKNEKNDAPDFEEPEVMIDDI